MARQTRGDKFIADVSGKYDLRPDEALVLAEVGATIDVIDRLKPSEHVEARQQRLALARLLGMLGLAGEEAPSMSGPSVRGRRAAEARWKRARNEGAA